jgi:hypothetical protein
VRRGRSCGAARSKRYKPVSDIADVEGLLVHALRAGLGDGQVWFGKDDLEAGDVLVSRIGGGLDDTEASLDAAIMQLDVWGVPRAKGACWERTSLVLGLLREWQRSKQTAAFTGPGGAFAVSSTSWTWAPDPVSERARYVITATVTAFPG